MMQRLVVLWFALTVAVALAVAGCSQASPAPAPTKSAPAAEATKAPASQPAAAPTAAPAPATKVAYPEKGKAITIIVPWAAGSPNDLWARLLGSFMEKELGTPVQVVPKPGASSQVGMTELAQAKPDGYTLGVNSLQTTIATYLDPERKAVFGRKDLAPIAVGLYEPFGLVVKGDSPYKTTKELVEAAKANPEKIKVGDNGLMSPAQMGVLLLEKAAGVKFAAVHFTGSSESVAALLGGHVDVSSIIATGFQGQLASGTIRGLGVFDKEESKSFPGVKTIPSQGWDAVMVRTLGLDAPGKTPPEIVSLLNDTVGKISKNPEYLKKAEEAGMIVKYMPTSQYVAHWDEVEAQIKTVIDMIKAGNK
ncbi:MAG: tripartite tricarboxylate transporter substrate binding protein [Sphingomonadaceae bacterium]